MCQQPRCIYIELQMKEDLLFVVWLSYYIDAHDRRFKVFWRVSKIIDSCGNRCLIDCPLAAVIVRLSIRSNRPSLYSTL